MKKLIACICTVLMVSTSFAAQNRTENLLTEDSYDRLDSIMKIKTDLAKNEVALASLRKQLSEEIIKANKQKNAKITLALGAAGLTVLALASGPIARRLESKGVAFSDLENMLHVIFGFTTATSVVAIPVGGLNYFININDAKEIAEKVKLAEIENQKIQANLNKEVTQLCKIDSRHKLCY